MRLIEIQMGSPMIAFSSPLNEGLGQSPRIIPLVQIQERLITLMDNIEVLELMHPSW